MTIEWETSVRAPIRLETVRASMAHLGMDPEDAFDRLIELAVELVGVARGCITLVDAERTTAKSIMGFPEGSPNWAPVELSFCRFVVGTGRPLIVNDAHLDPRTQGDAAIALYDAAAWAGYPIENGEGVVLGTFCLMDPSPHEWTPRDLHILATLAQAASAQIALRNTQVRLADALHQLGLLGFAGN